jgi:hypothetical protein
MPKCIATGARIGASTMMAALVSMNMPITNSAAFTPKQEHGRRLQHAWSSQMPIASGTPARVIRKANRPALAMMNMITARGDHRLAQHRVRAVARRISR